jgi:hypothetical protein
MFIEYMFPSKSWQNESAYIKKSSTTRESKCKTVDLMSAYKNISEVCKIKAQKIVHTFPPPNNS